MEKQDLCIFVLFFLIILSLGLTLYQIHRFMPVLKTCDDDFAAINKCGCVPCSWKDAEKLNQFPCMNINYFNISDG
jgi:hypothetical protein